MILRRLHLRRFGRFKDAEWEFAPGLTVIRGPNEAGKSTMREAIARLLLTEKKVDTQDSGYLALRSWGSDQRFILDCEFEARGDVYELTRDFETERVELRCTSSGEVLTEEPPVAERMYELLGVSSREVYETTACLAQQEFVRLDAGRKVAELLQQTVVGAGGESGAQGVLSELDGRIGALSRGLERHAKNPGAVRETMDRIETLESEIAHLRPIVERATDAADRIERARERIAEVERELQQAQRIRERAEQRRKLEEQLESVNKKFHALEQHASGARDLKERIASTEKRLRALPDVTREQVEELAKLIDAAELARERVPEAEQAAEDAAEQARQAREQVEAAEERAPDEGEVTRGQHLEREISELEEDVRHAERAASRAEQDLEESRQATRAQQAWLVAAGTLIVAGAGLGLALGQAWPWIVTGLGLIVGVMGSLRGPRMSVEEAEARHEEACAAAGEQRETLSAMRDELAKLLDQTDASSTDELSRSLTRAREQAEDAREAQAAAAAVAKTEAQQADRARQQAEIAEARLKHKLDQLGAESPEEFLTTAREVFDLRERREELRARIEGVLGDQELGEIESAVTELAGDRMGLQQKLDSEEMAWAELDAEGFEELTTQIEALEAEREAFRAQIDDARGAADHPEADPERLRRLQEQLAGAREDLERVRERLEALRLAREVLAQAHEETLEGAIDVLEPRTSELLADLTEGRYCSVEFDRSTLEPSVHSAEKGCAVDPDEELSCATREQVYLAARLALTGLLWPEECPPIMLDDPFVNFDPNRRAEALQIVRHMAADQQILLFTCERHYDAEADVVVELPPPS